MVAATLLNAGLWDLAHHPDKNTGYPLGTSSEPQSCLLQNFHRW